MRSYLPAVVDASRVTESPVAGTSAGTVVVRAADLRVRGKTVTGGAAPSAGELAMSCRPVVTAPTVVRRDGTVLAGGWLPDYVRLGELERHLGDGVIEAAVDAAVAEGRRSRSGASTQVRVVWPDPVHADLLCPYPGQVAAEAVPQVVVAAVGDAAAVAVAQQLPVGWRVALVGVPEQGGHASINGRGGPLSYDAAHHRWTAYCDAAGAIRRVTERPVDGLPQLVRRARLAVAPRSGIRIPRLGLYSSDDVLSSAGTRVLMSNRWRQGQSPPHPARAGTDTPPRRTSGS